MKVRLRQLATHLAESFWLVPATMVLGSVVLAMLLLAVDRQDLLPAWLTKSNWLYNGGGEGARTLLGAIASSTIGVAGTVFSITIAALSLAAGQMGPRLLRNFTRDRGNQATLGVFLGTFSYALMVLRSVRTQEEGLFTPHIALTFGIALAFVCVATLVYFVGHMASRINVDTVIDLVSEDVRSGLKDLVTDTVPVAGLPTAAWNDATPVLDARRGYLQHVDRQGLATWAAKNGTRLRLLVGPGDYVFPGAPIAVMVPAVPDAENAIHDATALGRTRSRAGDTEQAIRQLVEVAVRALSPGINDPHTAMSVLDRLGSSLCDLSGRLLKTGVIAHEGVASLMVPSLTYAQLTDIMFHMIRQNAEGNAAVYLSMLSVLCATVTCELDADRRVALSRHADLVIDDARRSVGNASDRADVERRHSMFATLRDGNMRDVLALVDAH
ncbi:MAG: DUF2254 domain-containing protein [Dokdonella sp.]